MGEPAGDTQEEGHTGFLIHLLSAVRALIFLARRIQPFLSLVDGEVEFLCTNDLIVLHPLGMLCVCVCVFIKCVCVCVCVFIKLHITAQSGLVILVILCHSR